MNDGAFCGSAKKIGTWFGRGRKEVKRIFSFRLGADDEAASCSLAVETPVEDVMDPIGLDEEKGEERSVVQSSDESCDDSRQAASTDDRKDEDAMVATACPREQAGLSAADGRLIGVLEDVIRLQDEIGRMRKGLDDEASAALEHVGFRLEELLDRSGATPIDGDRLFDVRRHRPDPVSVVADGTPIVETIVPGWMIGARILRRASVVVSRH